MGWSLACVPALRRNDRTFNAPEHLDLVQALPLLPASVAGRFQEWLARSLTQVTASPGEVLIREGEPGATGSI